jgi:hypothetical protein
MFGVQGACIFLQHFSLNGAAAAPHPLSSTPAAEDVMMMMLHSGADGAENAAQWAANQ